MSQARLPSKEAREQHMLLKTLGYRLDRHDGGHLVYEHDEQAPFVCAATPSDFRAGRAVLAELKRRHPEFFARPKSQREKRLGRTRSETREHELRRLSAEADRAAEALAERERPAPVVLDFTGCWACGYRWQSDLNPVGRLCPRCDEPIRVGRERRQVFAPAAQPWQPRKRRAA